MMLDMGGNRMTVDEVKQRPALCMVQSFTADNRVVFTFVESVQKFDNVDDARKYCAEQDIQLLKWPFSPEDVLKMQIGFSE